MTVAGAPIIHPTDLSSDSMNAFGHALKISIAAKCKLYVAHVADRSDVNEWHAFPHVRQTLAQWGLIEADAPTAAIAERLGVEVLKVEIEPQNPVRGVTRFLESHPSELMVLATQGREGLPRWLQPSIAEAISRRAHMQTLFIPPHSRSLVDRATGALNLDRILIPVDHQPAPTGAIKAIQRFYRALGAKPAIRIVHIGKSAPVLAPVLATVSDPAQPEPIEVRDGDVVEGILQAASELGANLIGMPTAGHHGPLDALRGSTTERVVRHAPCPVLAIPAPPARSVRD